MDEMNAILRVIRYFVEIPGIILAVTEVSNEWDRHIFAYRKLRLIRVC